MEERIQRTIQALESNGFEVSYHLTQVEAKAALLADIDKGKSVAIGGSKTIFDMGLHEDLIAEGHEVLWHWLVPVEERAAIRDKARLADVYLSSTNAITEQGTLINIDGTGNRLSALIYGHQKVHIIAGVNKIAANHEAAMTRIKEVACPQNAERLGLDVPCRYTGKCSDCKSKQRMCNATLILEKRLSNTPVHIYLVNETLGF